jgi:hypothetical protein
VRTRLFTQRLERVVNLGERDPTLLEHHRHAAKLDIGRQRFHPRLQHRFEVGAVRASVRKEFHHFNLLAGLDGHRVLEADVLLAFLQLLGA